MAEIILFFNENFNSFFSGFSAPSAGQVLSFSSLGKASKRSKAIVRIFRSDGTMVGEFKAYPDSMRFGVKISKGTVGE